MALPKHTAYFSILALLDQKLSITSCTFFRVLTIKLKRACRDPLLVFKGLPLPWNQESLLHLRTPGCQTKVRCGAQGAREGSFPNIGNFSVWGPFAFLPRSVQYCTTVIVNLAKLLSKGQCQLPLHSSCSSLQMWNCNYVGL